MIKPFLLLIMYGLSIIAMESQEVSIPNLQELCLNKLIIIPPEQFNYFQNLPPILKEKFIIKYGPTYTSSIFSIATDRDNEDHVRIKGSLLDEQNLRLRNRFIDLLISKEHSNQQNEGKLAAPLCTFAYLHHDNLYIVTQSGEIAFYKIKHRRPLLIDTHHLTEHAIIELAVHPKIEHLIACRYSNNTIEIFKRDRNMSWSCIKNIANNHRRIVHMSFSPLDEWFAYAEQFKVYLYALHQEQEQIDPIKTYICPESINALIFDENENLIIQTSKGFLAIQQLFVWKFGSQNNVSSCTVWQDTAKIVLRQDRSCDLLINADEISTIAHQIMFKSQLANIKTCAQLEHFKKYANTLRCEEQPLFKLIAITNKAAELHKSLEQK